MVLKITYYLMQPLYVVKYQVRPSLLDDAQSNASLQSSLFMGILLLIQIFVTTYFINLIGVRASTDSLS